MSAIYFREAVLEAGAMDVAAGRARLSFSSELPLLRHDDPKYGTHLEVLSHGPGDCNLGLLNREGVILFNHEPEVQIGCVVRGSARIDADRMARATIEIDPEWRPYLQKISNGDVPNQVSVGYSRIAVVSRGPTIDGIPVLKFSWFPNEISLLTPAHPPADSTVGFGRSKPIMKSFDEILSLALSGSRKTDGNWSDYSLCEALRTLDKEPHGLIREADQSERKIAGERLTGRWVPFEALAPRRRDLTAGNFGSAGALAESATHYPIVQVLRNKVCAIPLGARVISGLTGTFVLPRATSATTPQALPEIAALTPSTPTFDQFGILPKRISVQIVVSLQWLMQTGDAAEQYLRQEVADQIGVFFDRLILDGQGGAEPLGIMNTPGVGSVVYGAGWPSVWPSVLASELNLATANADISDGLGWAVSPLTRNHWKQTSKIALSNIPIFIWENGLVNEYPAIATNSLSGTNQTVFGNWKDLLVLLWGNGTEFIFDPYTKASTGNMVITANFWGNLVMRHAQSFCVSADSAAA